MSSSSSSRHHDPHRWDEPVATGVGGLMSTAADDPMCGFVCCPPPGMQTRDKDVPAQFADLYTQAEWTSLTTAVNSSLSSTYVPLLPCLWTMICMPPVCCYLLWHQVQRQPRLQRIVAAENERLRPRGLEWLLTPFRMRSGCIIMALRWTKERPAFEAANPQRRAVSREPLPIDFMSKEMRMQLAVAAMSPELIALQGRQAAVQLGVAPAPMHQSMELQRIAPHQQGRLEQEQALMQAQRSEPGAASCSTSPAHTDATLAASPTAQADCSAEGVPSCSPAAADAGAATVTAGAPPSSAVPRFCGHCGTATTPLSTAFCSSCGGRLTAPV